MKVRNIAVAVATAAAMATSASPALAAGNHGCNVSTGWVTASGNTSCAFARSISNVWVRGDCRYRTDCSFTAYSPATRIRYGVYCWQISASARQQHDRSTSGTNSWIEFYWRFS